MHGLVQHIDTVLPELSNQARDEQASAFKLLTLTVPFYLQCLQARFLEAVRWHCHWAKEERAMEVCEGGVEEQLLNQQQYTSS